MGVDKRTAALKSGRGRGHPLSALSEPLNHVPGRCGPLPGREARRGSRCAQWPGVIPRPLTQWTSRPHFEQLSETSRARAPRSILRCAGGRMVVSRDRPVRARDSRRGRRRSRVLGVMWQPDWEDGLGAARWSGLGLHVMAASAVQPGGPPDRPVRPAQLRAEHAEREHAPHRPWQQHHAEPCRGHRAAPNAPRGRALAGNRRIVGERARARLRRAASGPGYRDGSVGSELGAALGVRLVVPRWRGCLLPRAVGAAPELVAGERARYSTGWASKPSRSTASTKQFTSIGMGLER